RVLLKLSGEALGCPYDTDVLEDLARQIKKLVKDGIEVGIVVGGGNICRGRTFEKLGFDKREADYVGMEATVMNAQMLTAALHKNGIEARTMSTIKVQRVMDYDKDKAVRLLKKKIVVVFGGGTGKPFFSTDTGSAMRAQEIGADVILMAKSGVDGVYTADPDVDPTATRYDEITFDDIIKNNLEVIDLRAAKICRKSHIQAFVFNMAEKDNIIKAAKGKAVGTVIK
ncbi:MAG: UMP kinase, partial [Erysipelotrichaceae bacterium]|nr:UMP kinase [Erysipelotrichaceae bacterium]